MIWGGATIFFALLPFFLLIKTSAIRLEETFFPIHGDFLLTSTWIQEVLRGGFSPFARNELSRMAAPFGPLSLSAGFPVAEQFQLLVLQFWGRFSSDPVVVWNLHFLSGYILAAAAFYFSAIWLRVKPAFAFALATAFAYVPYHSLRYEHLFLSHYWVLAPAAAVLFHLIRRERPLRIRFLFWLGLSVFLVTLWHSYYGYFYGGLLGLVLAWKAIRVRSFAPLVGILAVGIPFVAAIGISTAHHFSALQNSTEKPPAFVRDPGDALLYSLRPEAVLLPIEDHRFPLFQWTRDRYLKDRFRIEGLTESIGTLGLLGFLIGVWSLVRKRRAQWDTGVLSLFVFLFSFRAGIGAAIAFTVFPVFRATNRISPLLAAITLLGLGMFLSDRVKRRPLGVALALTVFALWDLVLPSPRPVAEHAAMESAKEFVANIETQVGDGAVLQLPVVAFPEQPTLHRMTDYSHAVGPLFSERTRWSYGAWENSESLAKIRSLATRLEIANPLGADDLRAAREMGYAGIWIDRFGYEDGGVSIVRRLTKAGAGDSIESRNQRRVFFILRDSDTDR